MNKDIRADMEKISSYRSKTGVSQRLIDQIKYNFKRVNGDLRVDSLEKEVSILMSSYYSLFTY